MEDPKIADHYTKEELGVYRNGCMSPWARLVCSWHLRICGFCAKRLEEVAEDEKLIAALRKTVQQYAEAEANSDQSLK